MGVRAGGHPPMDHQAGNCSMMGIENVHTSSAERSGLDTLKDLPDDCASDNCSSLDMTNGASILETINTGLLIQIHSILVPTDRLPLIERRKSCLNGKSAARIALPGEK